MVDTHRDSLKISNWNANSIRPKIREFNNFLQDEFIDVACIQETMLSTNDLLPTNHNFSLYRLDRDNTPNNRPSGGVALMIRRSLKHKLLPSLNLTLIEAIGVEILLDNQSRIEIWSAYLPGGTNVSNIRQNYRNDISKLTNRRCSYFINGDFNSRHRLWNCARANVAGDILFREHSIRHFFILHPSAPTRFPSNPNNLPSTIDLTLTNGLHDTTDLDTHSTDSDHVIITYSIHLNERTIHNNPFLIPLFRKADWSKFRTTVHQELMRYPAPDLNQVTTTTQVDDLIEKFTDALSNAQKVSVPMVRRTPYAVCLPPELKAKIQRKNNLRRTSQRYPQVQWMLRPRINEIAKEIQQEINEIVNDDYNQMLSEIDRSDSSVKLWQTTRFLRNRRKQIPPLKVDNRTLLTPEEKSNALADQFLMNHDNSLSDSNITHTRYVENKVRRYINNCEPLQTSIELTDVQEVKHVVSRLRRSKAPGLDKMHNNLLKSLPPSGYEYLTLIFNCCLRLCYFPTSWKSAKVIGIHKPGKPPSSPLSYRPISLLSSLSKVLERIILTRLKLHLELNNIIPSHQHGFRERHSTTTQLRRLVNHIKSGLSSRLSTGLVLCDIEKAFDKVWHDGLMYKLIAIDTPQYIVRIIKSFLQDRKFTVYVQNKPSMTHEISYGVPQGAVMSPILYNIYTHDIPTHNTCSIAQFADDTAFFISSKFAKTIMKSLEDYARKLHRYFRLWKISINPTKSQAIFYTRRRTRQLPQRNLNIFESEVPWEENSIKYLGVILDKKLTFKEHTFHILKKSDIAIKALYSLLSRKSRLARDCKLLLYKVAIRPIMTYAAPVFNSMATIHKKRLQIAQNKVLKMILDVPYRTSTDFVHQTTGMAKLSEFMRRLTEDFDNRHD